MELPAVRAPVGQALMFRHDGRRVGDFHLLEHFGLAPRKDQRAATVRATVECVGLEMADRLGWKRGPQVLLMSRLSALLPLLAALGQRLLRLDDVARRRLGGGGGILARGGQLLLQAGVLLFQLRDAFHRLEQLVLQRRNTLRQVLTVQTGACFPQLHGAGRYAFLPVRSRSTGCLPNAESWQILGGGGA